MKSSKTRKGTKSSMSVCVCECVLCVRRSSSGDACWCAALSISVV